MFFLLLIVLAALLLESVAITLPLFLIVVLVMLVIFSEKQNNLVLALAFFGGLILDVSAVRYLGSTSLFLTCWLFLILLYERKYEINTIPFVLASSFFGIILYLWFFGYGEILIQAGVGSIIAVLLFKILSVRSAPQNFQFSIFNFH